MSDLRTPDEGAPGISQVVGGVQRDPQGHPSSSRPLVAAVATGSPIMCLKPANGVDQGQDLRPAVSQAEATCKLEGDVDCKQEPLQVCSESGDPQQQAQLQQQPQQQQQQQQQQQHQQEARPVSYNRPQKYCAVCGDKAIACNFNAVTCESCKAFFRRNAFKEQRLRCLFENACVIDRVTRRFCSKCRLLKCFAIGMRREWILTDEQKHIKRVKIMQNKQARNEQHQQQDRQHQQQGTPLATPLGPSDYESSPEGGSASARPFTRSSATTSPLGDFRPQEQLNGGSGSATGAGHSPGASCGSLSSGPPQHPKKRHYANCDTPGDELRLTPLMAVRPAPVERRDAATNCPDDSDLAAGRLLHCCTLAHQCHFCSLKLSAGLGPGAPGSPQIAYDKKGPPLGHCAPLAPPRHTPLHLLHNHQHHPQQHPHATQPHTLSGGSSSSSNNNNNNDDTNQPSHGASSQAHQPASLYAQAVHLPPSSHAYYPQSPVIVHHVGGAPAVAPGAQYTHQAHQPPRFDQTGAGGPGLAACCFNSATWRPRDTPESGCPADVPAAEHPSGASGPAATCGASPKLHLMESAASQVARESGRAAAPAKTSPVARATPEPPDGAPVVQVRPPESTAQVAPGAGEDEAPEDETGAEDEDDEEEGQEEGEEEEEEREDSRLALSGTASGPGAKVKCGQQPQPQQQQQQQPAQSLQLQPQTQPAMGADGCEESGPLSEWRGELYCAPAASEPEIRARIERLGFSDTERRLIHEMLDATRLVFEPQERMNNDSLLDDIVFFCDAALRRLIKTVKQITAFRMLTMDDQIVLLKNACFKILLLRSSFHYQDEVEGWRDKSGRVMPLSSLKTEKCYNYERHKAIMDKLAVPLRRDRLLMAFMILIILFDPTVSLKHANSVGLDNMLYLCTLRKYLVGTQPDPLAKYERIVETLQLINACNEEYNLFFSRNYQPEEITPLLIEIFDISINDPM